MFTTGLSHDKNDIFAMVEHNADFIKYYPRKML